MEKIVVSKKKLILAILWNSFVVISLGFAAIFLLGEHDSCALVIGCFCLYQAGAFIDGRIYRIQKRKALMYHLRQEEPNIKEMSSQEEWDLINELIIHKDH